MRDTLTMATMAILTLTAATSPFTGSAQEPDTTGSDDEVCFGALGVGSFRGGRISISQNDDGTLDFTIYSEPVMTAFFGDAADKLRPGDILMGLDGHLITTDAGNRRFNSLEPDERVDVQVRRDGQPLTVTVTAARRCLPSPSTAAAPTRPARPDRLEGDIIAPPRPDDPPHVYLGLTLRCGICGVRPTRDGGREWFFRGPVEVVEVVKGGPASRANIPEGWELHSIDGHALDTPEGARIFQSLTPGEEYLIMSRKPGTRTFNVGTLIPAPPRDSSGLSREQKLMGLSTIWQEANYNFAFFDQVPELDWDSAYQAFMPQVLATRSLYDYYRTLTRFVALLHDGHSNIYLPRPLRDAPAESEPWIRTRRVAGRALVRNVGRSLAGAIPVGSEIVAVDGLATSEHVRRRVLPFVSASTRHDRLERAFRAMLEGRTSDSVRVVWETPDGLRRSRTLPRNAHLDIDRWTVSPDAPAPFDLRWPADGVAYAALNTFARNETADAFEAALPELRQARALILDVRRNRGGNSTVGYAVAAWLTGDTLETSAWRTREHRAAFKAWGLFDEEREKWARMNAWYEGGHGQIAPAEGERLTVPIVVLQEHATFSAAEDFLVALEAAPHVTTVGRTTAGSTGQPLFFRLPGGGYGRVCAKRDTYSDGRDFVGVGIPPDVIVEPSVADVRAGRDLQLERALELLTAGVGGPQLAGP